MIKAILLAMTILTSSSLCSQDITGQWNGLPEIKGIQLRVIFNIDKKDSGYRATMDSPDQGGKGIPVTSMTFEKSVLTIEIKNIGFTYVGELTKDNIIVGNFKQAGQSFALNLTREEVRKKVRLQEPQKPYPYEVEEVEYTNEKAGINLAGTLTYPRSEGPFPAVILISGSGAQDRNGALFGHKPFLVLADHLTRNGIAVLRVDDRGVGGSAGSVSNSTSVDFSGDVLAGVSYLKSRENIHSKHIGLIGHSEGGVIAPIVAGKSSDISFIVLMAGPGLTGEEIVHLQQALIASANGFSQEAIDKSRKKQEQIFDVIKEVKDDSIAEKRLRDIMEKGAETSSKETQERRKAIDAQIKAMLSPWYRYFLTYDPKVALRKVTCPVLSIIGEKDSQVPPTKNSIAIEEALRASGNTDYTITVLPQLNHLFQKADTGSLSEYAIIEQTLSPLALNAISNWILRHVKP